MRRRSFVGAGAAAFIAGCGVVARPGSRATPEQQWARTAWRYLENNTDDDTGLVGGMDRSPVFTASNAADALAAIVCARELDVIDAREFDLRLSRVLGFLGTMELSNGELPNKAYSARTAKMVGFDGRPADIGWSALDIGRLLLWLKITGLRHPHFAEYADKAVLRWRFCDVIGDCGVLWGSAREAGLLQRYTEGRLGYAQVAAAGYAVWGFDARGTLALPATQVAYVYDRALRHDARDPRTSGAQAPVLTLPYVLAGIELGWALAPLKDLAQTVYEVQEQRFRREHIFTARSDYQIAQAPYTVLDSVYAAGYAFNTIAHDGSHHERLALVNTRAAFGMAALWPGEYTRELVAHIAHMYDPDRGWYEGRLEAGGAPQTSITLATNAVVLETLLFRARGAFYQPGAQVPGPFQVQTSDPFNRQNRCWPAERAACRRS